MVCVLTDHPTLSLAKILWSESLQTTHLIIALILKTTIIFAAHEKIDFCSDPLRTP